MNGFRKKLTWWSMLLCILIFVTGLGVTASAETPVQVRYSGTADYDYAESVLNMINEERSKENLPALVSNPTLQSEAMHRAAELAVYYSHTRPDGTSCFSVMSKPGHAIGENIAAGYATAEAVMNGWMNSSGHRANILNSDFNQVGVGCFWHNDIYYWVQLFDSGRVSAARKTGYEDIDFEASILPSLMKLSFNTEPFELDEGKSWNVWIMNQNAGWEYAQAALRADSPAFTWSVSGNSISAVPGQEGATRTITGLRYGIGTVHMTCSGTSISLNVSVAHVPGVMSCEEGLSCTVCKEQLEPAPGHDKNELNPCQKGIYCTRCGEVFKEPGHVPGPEPTCTETQNCMVCNGVLQYALGHDKTEEDRCKYGVRCTRCGKQFEAPGHVDYGFPPTCTQDRICVECGVVLLERLGHDFSEATCTEKSWCRRCYETTGDYAPHSWGSWRVVSEATTEAPELQERTCSECWKSETRTVGEKLVSIEEASITVSSKQYTYTGSRIKPSVKVVYDGRKLVKNEDYKLSYSSNIEAGTGKVTIRGIGGFTGSVTKKFQIGQASQSVKASTAKNTLSVGKKMAVSASGKGKITYASSNSKIAAVSSDGVITAKWPGTVKITVRAAGNDNYKAAKKTLTITVNPKNTKFTAYKAKGSGKVYVKWSKISNVTGYQVLYKSDSTKKTVTVSKYNTSKTLSGLKKGKTYRIFVRTYKKSGSKTYYSGWSSAKSIIVK